MKNKKTGQIAFWLTIVMIVMSLMIAAIVLMLTASLERTVSFNDAFRNGKIPLVGNYITLGTKGSPMYVEELVDLEIPNGNNTIQSFPRQFQISGCLHLDLLNEAVGINTATAFPSAELVQITLAPDPIGGVTICVPDGVTISVVMWIR